MSTKEPWWLRIDGDEDVDPEYSTLAGARHTTVPVVGDLLMEVQTSRSGTCQMKRWFRVVGREFWAMHTGGGAMIQGWYVDVQHPPEKVEAL